MSLLDLLADDLREQLVQTWGLDCVSWVLGHVQQKDLGLEPNSTCVSQEIFVRWLGLPGDPPQLCGLLWSACCNDNGEVTVPDIFTLCATIAQGSPEQRAELGFRICDTKRNGSIGHDELKGVCQAILQARYAAVGGEKNDNPSRDTAVDEYVASLLAQVGADSGDGTCDAMDTAVNARISKDQWRQAFCGTSSATLKDFVRRCLPTCEAEGSMGDSASQVKSQQIFGQRCRSALQMMSALELTTRRAERCRTYMECMAQVQGRKAANTDTQDIGGICVTTQDFEYTITLQFPMDEELRTTDNSFQVEAFAPKVFQGIRRLDGVGDGVLCSSLGTHQFFGGILLGEPIMLTDFKTQAKSGCVFFITPDRQFLIKTLKEAEKAQLLEMLPQYASHLANNPESLITRYLALCTLSDENWGEDVDFVVMRNMLAHIDVAMSSRFDLKGCASRDDVRLGTGLLCEQTWLDRKNVLGLTPSASSAMLSALKKDVDWLMAQNLMDYSLLVCFFDTSAILDRQFHSGGSSTWLSLPAHDGQWFASFSIIDVLTFYGFKKKMETKLKSAFAFGADIVCISADLYGQRFQKFMIDHVILGRDEQALGKLTVVATPSGSATPLTACTTPAATPRVAASPATELMKAFQKAGERIESGDPYTKTSQVDARPLKPGQVQNANRISQYVWLLELLEMISGGSSQLTVRDADRHERRGTPLFLVAGACPTQVCGIRIGMQAVMFCQMEDAVQFWWVKPRKDDPTKLERNTMNLHSNGEFKNAPGKSKAFLEVLGEKFGGVRDGDFTFGVDKFGRAFIDEVGAGGETNRMLLYFVWQEKWSSVLARTPFLQGKLFYQKGAPWHSCPSDAAGGFFARQYRILGSQLSIMGIETEEAVPTLLPPDSFQQMYAMPA